MRSFAEVEASPFRPVPDRIMAANEMDRASKRVLIPLAAVIFAFFVVVARSRFVDADEGFYLLASRLIFQHEVPYRDFFYTQMPLLPYVYGLWMHVFGFSWLAGRFLSACFTTSLAILVYIQICRQTGRWVLAVCGVLLFASSALIFGWMPLAKTYALSSLLLFACYMAVCRGLSVPSKRVLFFGGLLLGLSVDVRLYFAALLPVVFLWIYRHAETGAKSRVLSSFAAGFIIAMLPCVHLFAFHRSAFLFNVIGYHAIRSNAGLVGGIGQKIVTLITSTIVGSQQNGIQLGTLLAVSSIAICKTRVSDAFRLSYYIAICLGFISLLPTPTYGQYFCVIVPFLIVCVACFLSELLLRMGENQRRRFSVLVACSLLAYLAVSIADYPGFCVSGKDVIDQSKSEGRENWNLHNVRLVSAAINGLARPGETVVSFWPGYIFESSTSPHPGLECDSGIIISAKMSSAQQLKYHIASRRQIESEIRLRQLRIVVVGNQEYWHQSREPYVEALAQAGYRIDRKIGDTLIYIRK